MTSIRLLPNRGKNLVFKRLLLVFLVLIGYASTSFVHADCVPTVNLGNIIQTCQGNNVQLNAFNNGASYLWSTGDTTSSIVVTTPGVYHVTVTNSCGSAFDSVNVIVSQHAQVNLGPDIKFCSQQPFSQTLSVPQVPGTSYQWSTGGLTNSINITQAGTYWVTATNACGTYSDTINIIPEMPNNINLGNDTIICQSNSHTLSVGNVTGSISWSNGDTTSQINVSTSGVYSVTVTNSCGSVTDSVELFFVQDGFPISSPASICNGTPVSLNLGFTSFPYQWQFNGNPHNQTSATQPGTYIVSMNTPCGVISDTLVVVQSGAPSISNLPDTVRFCQGDSVLITPQINGNATVQWSHGPTTDSAYVRTQGTVSITVTNGCGSVTESVVVRRVNRVRTQNIVPEYFICNGQSVDVDAYSGRAGTTYTWSNGGGNDSIRSFNQLGNYSVTLSDSCGQRTYNFSILPPDTVDFSFSEDTVFICAPNYVVNPGITHPTFSYLWNTNDTTPTISVTSSGWYTVTISNGCDSKTDSIYVEIDVVPNISMPSEVRICQGENAILSSTNQSGVTYQWSTGDTTHSITVNQAGWYTLYAYNRCDTLLDSVQVIVDQPINLPQLLNNPQYTICSGDTLMIPIYVPSDANISWSHGPNSDTVYFTSGGVFVYTIYNACDTIVDTISVIQNSIPPRVLPDTVYLCTGQTTMLDAGVGNSNAVWHDLTIGRFFQVHAAGTYHVTLMNNCGFRTDTVVVIEHSPINSIDLGNDTIFCEGTLLLDPLPNAGLGYHIVWNNNIHAATFTVTQSGTYTVMAYNACDTVHDTINVLITGAPNLNLGAFVYFCSGSDLILDAQNPGSSYYWSNGDTTQTTSINIPGWYSVEITNGCGSYIDSIEVRVDSAMNIDFGNDTIVCIGDSLLLESGAKGHEIILWSTGQTTPSIHVSNTGTYWVRVDNACGRFTDTIYIEVVDEPDFEIRGDTVMCTSFGEPHKLSGPNNMMGYLWDNGSTSRVRYVQEPGTYHLTVFNGCFYKTDTITVTGHETVYVDLGFDEIFCINEPPILDPEVTDYPVVWQNGEVAPTFVPKETGWYKATVVNACGTFTDSVFLEKEVPIPFTPIDTAFCISESLNINLKELWPGDSVRWADGRANPSRTFTSFNELEYIVSNTCGEVTQTLKVETEVCDCPVYMANAFTPNGDGMNDEIHPMHECDMSSYTFRVFSRWGSMVFESNGNNEGWDGTLNGSPSPAGVYTYELSYSYWSKGYLHHRQKIGQITLIR